MNAPRRSRSTFIVGVLVATLVMAATLAYEAVQAARSHRATAENVLRDYSKFAAWELTRIARQNLLNAVHAELADVEAALKRGNLASALGTGSTCPSSCGGSHAVLTAFSGSLPDARFMSAGAAVPDEVREMLAKAASDGLRDTHGLACAAMRVVAIDGMPAAVVWGPVHDRRDDSAGIVGFVADLPFVTHVFQTVLRNTPLLPPALMAGEKDPNASLAVTVAAPGGSQLFASGTDSSRYETTERLPPDLGSLALTVALRADAAERLVIGGLPRARLPLIGGLLALTAGLVVVALVQLRREAELARMRSDFVSGVSHELRTPLAQIRMFTETLLLGRVRSTAEGHRSLEIVARETQRLIQLVENVLLFSRGERGRPEVILERGRLAPIVAEVVESFAPLAASRQARVVTRLDDRVSASVDAAALRQIVLNLLDNAVKYGPVGQTVVVQLTLDGDRARLRIDDEGPGIDASDAERIWQPFTRLARAGAATGGAGIGLAIVRQLAGLHGGRAWVERGGRGASFVVDLPGAALEGGACAVA